MFSVCSTRPVHGAAKYSSRWRAVFQANVATRPSVEIAEIVEHTAQPMGAFGPVAVRGAVDAGRGRGDDLLVGVELLRPAEQVRDGERIVLHQALHERPPSSMRAVRSLEPATASLIRRPVRSDRRVVCRSGRRALPIRPPPPHAAAGADRHPRRHGERRHRARADSRQPPPGPAHHPRRPQPPPPVGRRGRHRCGAVLPRRLLPAARVRPAVLPSRALVRRARDAMARGQGREGLDAAAPLARAEVRKVRLPARRGHAEQRHLPLRGDVGDAAAHLLDAQHRRHHRPPHLHLVPRQGAEGSTDDVPRLGAALSVAPARALGRRGHDPGLPSARPG